MEIDNRPNNFVTGCRDLISVRGYQPVLLSRLQGEIRDPLLSDRALPLDEG